MAENMEGTQLIHLNQARQALALAISIDEVKDIRDKAEALRAYAKQAGMTLEMQNHCAEIKLRAERRAGEMLAEMERSQGKRTDLTSAQDEPKSFKEQVEKLGIELPTAKRWQLEATVTEEKFERFIVERKERNEELTSLALCNLAKHGQAHVSYATGESEWYTPPAYIDAARQVMGSIDVDPASSDKANDIVKATTYYTPADDGRTKAWVGNVWLNPPYTQPLVSDFCKLLVEKYQSGEIAQACVLVNNATETGFYQRMLERCAAVCFIRGRVKFIDKNGVESGAPLQGQTILYFGRDREKFTLAFYKFGVILYAA